MRYPSMRRPAPRADTAVPRDVTPPDDELTRLYAMLKGYEQLCEEQRFQIMDLRLQRDEAIKTADVLGELRQQRISIETLMSAVRNFSL